MLSIHLKITQYSNIDPVLASRSTSRTSTASVNSRDSALSFRTTLNAYLRCSHSLLSAISSRKSATNLPSAFYPLVTILFAIDTITAPVSFLVFEHILLPKFDLSERPYLSNLHLLPSIPSSRPSFTNNDRRLALLSVPQPEPYSQRRNLSQLLPPPLRTLQNRPSDAPAPEQQQERTRRRGIHSPLLWQRG